MGQDGMLAQIRVLAKDALSCETGPLENFAVIGKTGQRQVWQAALTRSQHLARAAESQVHFSDLEAITGAHQYVQSMTSHRIAPFMNEDAMRRGGTSPDPAA